MKITIHATCDFGSDRALLTRLNLQNGGLVQKVIDNAVIRYAEDYVPFDTGSLARSPYTETVIGSGEVIYPGPYAHYMYYGEVYGPNIWNEDGHVENAPQPYFSPAGQSKYPTGRPITYATDKNPLAGSFWIPRMWADHKADIIREAKAAVGR